jgi:hypothetical protein
MVIELDGSEELIKKHSLLGSKRLKESILVEKSSRYGEKTGE